MNLHHAAALALVVWYLVYPTPPAPPSPCGAPGSAVLCWDTPPQSRTTTTIFLGDDLKGWTVIKIYRTERDCKAAQRRTSRALTKCVSG